MYDTFSLVHLGLKLIQALTLIWVRAGQELVELCQCTLMIGSPPSSRCLHPFEDRPGVSYHKWAVSMGRTACPEFLRDVV